MDLILPFITLGSLGLIFGVGLAFASKKFEVKLDQRLAKIHELLPQANCGACGQAGCFGFAEEILSGKILIDSCQVASDQSKEEIAKILGRALKKKIKTVACLHCNGGLKTVKDRFTYKGIPDCLALNLQMAGQKECLSGCLGMASCVKVCPFGALKMSQDTRLPVVDTEKCRSCNKCVDICPKKLFSLIPLPASKQAEKNTVYIACNSHSNGKDTRLVCPAGCIACKLCEKACKFNAITVIDNLATIDYNKCTGCGACIKVCPVKCILALS